MIKHASLFTGIGGFDLAAEWMGWENVFNCEKDEWCRNELKRLFPDVTQYDDIKTLNATKYNGTIDVLSGGFPCQPFSLAGHRRGKNDNRYLWPEMLRVIREVRPRFVVAENVPGLISQNRGLAFKQIIADLENESYETINFILPACGVNAPHRRDRVWIIAHAVGDTTRSSGKGGKVESGWRENHTQQESRRVEAKLTNGCAEFLRTSSNTDGERCSKPYIPKKSCKLGFVAGGNHAPIPTFEGFPTQSPICGGNDGVSNKLDRKALIKWLNNAIKAYGNAIVPQVALEIFKAIESVISQSYL